MIKGRRIYRAHRKTVSRGSSYYQLRKFRKETEYSVYNGVLELTEMLFQPTKQYIQRKLDPIIQKNNLLHGYAQPVGEIVHNGNTYAHSASLGYKRYYPKNPVHPQLAEEFSTYLEMLEEIDQEAFRSNQFLGILFVFVRDTQELRTLLGDSLFDVIHNKASAALRARYDVFNNNERNPARDAELAEFKKEHGDIIAAMQDRFVSNLLTTTLFNSE